MLHTLNEVEVLIDNTVSIPTVPTTLNEINRIINDPDGSAMEAADVVAKDPAIATKVLRLANSSLYSLRVDVSDVKHAVSILGLRILRNLVVQATILEQFKVAQKDRTSFDPEWLWDHSVKTASAARMLVEECEVPGVDAEAAYTAGLIHDVGKILLLQDPTERFLQAVEKSATTGEPLHSCEMEIYGFHHGHAGALLAMRWKLSTLLAHVIECHHDPLAEEEYLKVGCLLHCANGLAHAAATGNGGYVGDSLDEEILGTLGVDPTRVPELIQQVEQAELIG